MTRGRRNNAQPRAVHRAWVGPMEIKILSALLDGGATPEELAARTELPMPSVYALAGKLVGREAIDKDQAGAERSRVTYYINDQGKKLREQFAHDLGLSP